MSKSKIARWLGCGLLGLVLWAGSAQAQAAIKALLLTTVEPSRPDAQAAFNNIQSEFQDAGATVTRMSVLHTANSISAATFSAAPGPYDMVIVASAYVGIHPTNWLVLQNAISNRWAQSVVFFVDGCCDGAPNNTNNTPQLVTTLNNGLNGSYPPSPPFAFAKGTLHNDVFSFPLNTNSPYQSSFTGLNPFWGGYITYIDNVPANNALYLAQGASPPSAGVALQNNVYGLIVPTTQSNGGYGACVFATVDITSFTDPPLAPTAWTNNKGKIGPAFIDAIVSPTGACGLPKVGKAFGNKSLSLGGSNNTSELSISLYNPTVVPVAGVNLVDNLPAPLQVHSISSNTCTGGTLTATAGSSAINYSNFTIPGVTAITNPSGGCVVKVVVAWPNTAAGRAACANSATATVTNTITPGIDFTAPTGQDADVASDSLSCVPSPALPVPTIGMIELLLAMAALGATGLVAVNRRRHR